MFLYIDLDTIMPTKKPTAFKIKKQIFVYYLKKIDLN